MRAEYWAATWVKMIFSINGVVIMSVGIYGLASENIQEKFGLILLGTLILSLGFFFLVHAIAVIKWPVFITENNCIYYRGLFGCLYVYSNLERYRVDRGNQGMYLCDLQGKKHGLRTGLISRKKDDELYEYILRFCKPL